MDWQNLAYAATQIVHNFGAVGVVGGAASALAWRDNTARRRLAWIVLASWMAQAASGATFGAISFYFYREFPDIHGVAVAALGVKITCAALGLALAGWLTLVRPRAVSSQYAWLALFALGAAALSAAAVLRWFS